MIHPSNKSLSADRRGFTLIEVIIYLALFAILMAGTLASSFTLFESGGHNTARALLAEEGSFVITKMNVDTSLDPAQLVGGRVTMSNVSLNSGGGLRFTLSARTAQGALLSEDFFSTSSPRK